MEVLIELPPEVPNWVQSEIEQAHSLTFSIRQMCLFPVPMPLIIIEISNKIMIPSIQLSSCFTCLTTSSNLLAHLPACNMFVYQQQMERLRFVLNLNLCMGIEPKKTQVILWKEIKLSERLEIKTLN
jgi:hypothetical protein